MIRCEYCGEYGHDWDVHPEAVAESNAWREDGDDYSGIQEIAGWDFDY